MEYIINLFKSLMEPTLVLVVLILILMFNAWVFKRIKFVKSYGSVIKGTISVFVVMIGMLIFIFTFPMEKELRGQILSFLAIIISAGIALSSTTVLGNLIAGIMNNTMKRFKNGDLIQIGDLQGRVTKQSIFHAEIQLQDSNFITIPNLYIATNPVKLTRKTDTVISTSVSLGYDVSRIKIEEALKEAAILAELKDPYVYITSLGDFSVVYKIHGFLEDSSKYFSSFSLLNAKVMDVLHQNKIEIVSPAFMNQRNANEQIFIPKNELRHEQEEQEQLPEDLVFDEAIKSEEIEKKKELLEKLNKRKQELNKKKKELKDKADIERTKQSIEKIEILEENIEKSIEEETKEEN